MHHLQHVKRLLQVPAYRGPLRRSLCVVSAALVPGKCTRNPVTGIFRTPEARGWPCCNVSVCLTSRHGYQTARTDLDKQGLGGVVGHPPPLRLPFLGEDKGRLGDHFPVFIFLADILLASTALTGTRSKLRSTRKKRSPSRRIGAHREIA